MPLETSSPLDGLTNSNYMMRPGMTRLGDGRICAGRASLITRAPRRLRRVGARGADQRRGLRVRSAAPRPYGVQGGGDPTRACLSPPEQWAAVSQLGAKVLSTAQGGLRGGGGRSAASRRPTPIPTPQPDQGVERVRGRCGPCSRPCSRCSRRDRANDAPEGHRPRRARHCHPVNAVSPAAAVS
jgi:hypothetical protein